MKRLIIGDIPDNFKIEDDEVFAPYCFLHSQNKYSNWSNLNFKSDLNLTKIEKRDLDKRTSEFALQKINEIYPYFNSLNNLDFSFKFWKKILYTWTVSLIQHSYIRELQVKKIIKKINHPILVELIEEKVDWDINSTSDFFDLIQTVEYNHWLVSRFIENIAPSSWKILYVKPKNTFKKSETRRLFNFKDIFKLVLNKFFLRTVKIYGISILNQFLFEIKLRFKKPVLINKKPANDFSKNEKIKFSYEIDKLISLTQPNFLSNLFKLVKQNTRNFIPGKIILGGSQNLRGSDEFKVKIGLAVEHGEIFIGAQHGGDDYGMSLHCNEIYENEFNNYAFITWGWSQHSEYKSFFKSLPSPYLLKFKDKHSFKSDEIILVGTSSCLSDRFITARPSENQWIDYRRKKLELINKLFVKKLENKIHYRPFNEIEGCLEDESFFKRKIPSLKIINDDFHKKIMRCCLLIIDHPGTTLNIALAANIPTVLFWNKNHFPLEENAEKIINDFEKNNMFYDNSDDLVEFIFENHNNFKSWWNNPKIQTIRKNWCYNYSYTEKKWKKNWLEFINKI